MVAAAVGIGSAVAGLAGSALSSSAASSAASDQASAAAAAQAAQAKETAYNEGNQQPFVDAATGPGGALDQQANQLANYANDIAPYQNALSAAVPKPMTEAQLVQTPGYQFNLSQGLQATQNAAAARGLGVSGAALKGAATYATGLADSTYQNQFANEQTLYGDANTNLQNALSINNQRYNQTASRIQVGENASTQSGTQGQAGATNAGTISTNLGNALGASSIASGNALAGGANSVANAANQYNALQAYSGTGGVYTNGSGGGGSSPYDGQTVDTSNWGTG